MRILLYVDVQNGSVTSISRELVTAARELVGSQGSIDLAVFGYEPDVAKDLGGDRLFTLAEISSDGYNPSVHAACIEQAYKESNPDLVIFGYTTSGLDLGPMLAMRQDLPLLNYCSKLAISEGSITVESQFYGGMINANSTVKLPAVAIVNAGAFSESPPKDTAPEVIQIDLESASLPKNLRQISLSEPDPNSIDITQSKLLLCVGRGIGDEDWVREALLVAKEMGAELVASRPVVDAGWVQKERQVGKSGRTVKPDLYFALGVSGAPEHIEGMGKAGLIIAINTDERAPIFDFAHLGAHMDVADLLPALRDELKKRA